MGTAWLIRPDIMVTAGHCSFDWSHNFGRATAIKAYIGYSGKTSINDPKAGVQFRRGTRIVAHPVWVAADGNEHCDVSFIQLETPFTGIDVISWLETPTTGQESLTIVGYPADKSLDNEPGAQMYEMSKETSYDVAASGMLQYTISTYAGNSGSPVLRTDTKTAIGCHVLGGSKFNAASLIGKKFGNSFASFTRVFAMDISSAPLTPAQYRIVQVPDALDHDEGFIDILKSIVKVAAPLTGTVLSGLAPVLGAVPVIGPIAGTVAPVLGGILQQAGKACAESSFADGSAQNIIGGDVGGSHRSLLSEAALQSVLSMDVDTLQESGIWEMMKSAYQKASPVVSRVAKQLAPVIAEPVLRLALDEVLKAKSGKGEDAMVATTRRELADASNTTESFTPLIDSTNAFIKNLSGPTYQLGNDEEFFSDLRTTIIAGCSTPSYMQKLQAATAKGPEAAFTETETNMGALCGALCHRAVMGDAALQALMQCPATLLQKHNVYDSMKTVMQTIGPKVDKLDPIVVPAVKAVVAAYADEKSAPSTESAIPLIDVLLPTRSDAGANGFTGLSTSANSIKAVNGGVIGNKTELKDLLTNGNTRGNYIKANGYVKSQSSNLDGLALSTI